VRRSAEAKGDSELDLWMSEIRLRAVARIGQISRELEKAEAHGGKICLPSSWEGKRRATRSAGRSTRAEVRLLVGVFVSSRELPDIEVLAGFRQLTYFGTPFQIEVATARLFVVELLAFRRSQSVRRNRAKDPKLCSS
jgi:hypothetical protein